MLTVSSIAELRPLVKKWRREGDRIAFVPTMGNLHAGHLKLLDEASKAAERVIVSIFVNPSQFGPGEDFASYPRTEADDAKALASCSVDVLFLPRPEAMYAKDSGNVIIANNLASMITTYRDDPASLERAAAVARRLRDTDVPAFQDTYGWIEFRRGNPDEALKYLEPAATGLPGDMMVQYRLGLVYAALGRRDDAIRQLELAVSVAGGVASPQLETVQAALQRLQAGGKAEGTGGG